MADTFHYHPLCHLANGERLYFFLIRTTGDGKKSGDALKKALNDAKIANSAYCYNLFGEFDFILRVWTSQADCLIFENALREEQGFKKSFLDWRKMLVSRMSTWLQSQIEKNGALKNFLIGDERLNLIRKGPCPDELCIKVADLDHEKSTKFYMLIEEPYEAMQKAYGILHDLLSNDPNFEFLSTWSLYSIYYFPETNRGVQRRGVLLSASVKDLSQVSAKLLELSGELTRKATEMGVRAVGDGGDEGGSLFKTVTYICSGILKEHQGGVCSNSLSNKDVIDNLLLLHDNHTTNEKIHHNTKHQRDSFLDACVAISPKPLALFFRNFFTLPPKRSVANLVGDVSKKPLPSVPSWASIIRDVRFIYKHLVNDRVDEFEQFLFQRYVQVERELNERLGAGNRFLNPTLTEDQIAGKIQNQIEGLSISAAQQVDKTLGSEQRLRVTIENFKSLISKKLADPSFKLPKKQDPDGLTLAPLAERLRFLAEDSTVEEMLSKEKVAVLSTFAGIIHSTDKARPCTTHFRNQLFHGRRVGFDADDKPMWYCVVINYVQISLMLAEVLLILDELTQNLQRANRMIVPRWGV